MPPGSFAPLPNPSTPQSQRIYSPSLGTDHDLSTLPDPRSRTITPAHGEPLASPHHPDLDDEVATLSTKLINAINHQTSLDDTLSATRLELEQAYEKITRLEAKVASQQEMLAGDVWVKRKSVEVEKTKLLTRISDERRAKLEFEQQKKKIEQELENLTAALFEEANKMVISAKEEARAEQEALQRKNDLLKAQLVDTEGLLMSQQEQLAELKQVMEHMSTQRDDQPFTTMPPSPEMSRSDGDDETQTSDAAHSTGIEPPSPSHPTSFSYLLQPVLRTDLMAFSDFRELIRTSKRLSGQTSTLAPSSSLMGLGLGASSLTSPQSTISSVVSSTSNSPASSSPQTPNTPMSSVSSGSGGPVVILPPLKETKFYKRALLEDIEPTLRLDTAPGLSWLARRTVLSAMIDGTLVVEPVPATSSKNSKLVKPEYYPCSLCGETKRDDSHLRTHRFRTNESSSAQRYPLCKYCLVRVRSTCDFLGFLRIVKDGHWRADDDDAEKAAWEESVRLREQMFWSRIGGGVVPTGHHASPSPAPSIRASKSPRCSTEESVMTQEHAVQAKEEVASNLVDSAPAPVEVAGVEKDEARPLVVDGPVEEAHEVVTALPATADVDQAALPANTRDSMHSLSPREGQVRLSLTIPAAMAYTSPIG
jgi:hypothetical protein